MKDGSDRKKHSAGCKLKTKLVCIFLVLGFLPLFLLGTAGAVSFFKLEKTILLAISHNVDLEKDIHLKDKSSSKRAGQLLKEECSEYFSDSFKNYAFAFVSIFGLYLFFVVYAASRVSGVFVNDINKIKFALSSVVNKSFSFHVDLESSVEMKQLEYYLDRMSSVLLASEQQKEDAEKKLMAHQIELEALVDRRTSALKSANESLVATIRELNYRKRAANVFASMSEGLQGCSSREQALLIAGEACSKLFSSFSGALLAYNDGNGFLVPISQWNYDMFMHGAVSVKDCPAMLYRETLLYSCGQSASICSKIRSHGNRLFCCFPMADMEENIGILCLNFDSGEAVSSRQKRELEVFAASIADSVRSVCMNIHLKKQLKKEAIQDSLTGLFNRRYMESSLKREISRSRRYDSGLGVIMLDVDHFKNFNDEYGHQTGDKVLKGIGQWLMKKVRREDIVCRYGGEEFIILFPGIELIDLRKRAEFIRQGISEELSVQYENKKLGVTVSIGCCWNKGVLVEDSMVSNADKALYCAKEMGRNQVVIYEDGIIS